MSDESPSTRERGSSRRKRRKRSSSGGNWGVRILVVFGALGVLAILAWFGFGIWLKGYLKSEGFHNELSDKLAEKLKAKSEFEGLSWEDSGVQLSKMTSTGYKDAFFSQTTVEDVRADVKLDLWNRSVDVPVVQVSRVSVVVSEEGRIPRPYAAESTEESEPDAGPKKESFFDSLKPNKFTIKETKIDDISVSLKSKEGEVRLANLPLTLTSGQQSDSWIIESHPVNDRAVLMTNLGNGLRIKMKDLRARVRPGQFDLMEMAGEVEPLKRTGKPKDEFAATRLTVSGNLLSTDAMSSLEMDAQVTDIKLEDWIEEDWVKRLSGNADLKLHASGDPNSPTGIVLDGTFAMKRGVLTSLPFLESLAERTKTKEFTRLELNTAKWEFKRRGDVWNLDKIEIEARGLIRVEGYLTISGDQLKGVLQVGVAPGRLRAIDGAEQRVFTREENGYKWANPPMTVSGTIDDIREDLGTRIKDAWVDQQIENVTDLAGKAPEAVIKTGAEVIEQGTKAAPGLINEGVRLFNGLLPKGR